MAGNNISKWDVKYLPNIEGNRMAWPIIKSQALMVIFQLNLKQKNNVKKTDKNKVLKCQKGTGFVSTGDTFARYLIRFSK